jgi:superfamily I DNA and/or RNA helicase
LEAIKILKSQYGWKDDVIMNLVKRTGSGTKIASEIVPLYTNQREELALARIVGVTLHSSYVATGHMTLQPSSFDRIIMDEAGQVTPEQAWIPIRLLSPATSSTVTAYGDDIQLPPISTDFSQEKGVLRYLRTGNKNSVKMLDTTYRLNSPGVDMTSNIFYSGNLKAPMEVKERKLRLQVESNDPYRDIIDPDNTLMYVEVNGNEIKDGMSYDNFNQAKAINQICRIFIKYGLPTTSISVMSSYRSHVRSISQVLQGTGIKCTTVHKMLGGENEVIILATTRSNASRFLGFIAQPELLNVATSRQLKKLIIVGDNRDTFSEGSKTSRSMYDFITRKGSIITLN